MRSEEGKEDGDTYGSLSLVVQIAKSTKSPKTEDFVFFAFFRVFSLGGNVTFAKKQAIFFSLLFSLVCLVCVDQVICMTKLREVRNPIIPFKPRTPRLHFSFVPSPVRAFSFVPLAGVSVLFGPTLS